MASAISSGVARRSAGANRAWPSAPPDAAELWQAAQLAV
jgi:hypothetical protein